MICIFFDIDDTLLKCSSYEYAMNNYKINNQSIIWSNYSENIDYISKLIINDDNAHKYLTGSKVRIEMIRQWLENMHKLGITLITLTANYNSIVLPILNKMNILKYFSANIDRTDINYKYITPFSKSIIMNLIKKKNKYKHIIFVDDCKKNIFVARLNKIKSFYIASGRGIDDTAILEINNYVNKLLDNIQE